MNKHKNYFKTINDYKNKLYDNFHRLKNIKQ